MNSLYEKYHDSMKTFNVVDFDDLLLLTLRLFREHPMFSGSIRTGSDISW